MVPETQETDTKEQRGEAVVDIDTSLKLKEMDVERSVMFVTELRQNRSLGLRFICFYSSDQ